MSEFESTRISLATAMPVYERVVGAIASEFGDTFKHEELIVMGVALVMAAVGVMQEAGCQNFATLAQEVWNDLEKGATPDDGDKFGASVTPKVVH